jgi:hypothetical protein
VRVFRRRNALDSRRIGRRGIRRADVRHRPGDLLQPLLETVPEPSVLARELSLGRERDARLGRGHQTVVELATCNRLLASARRIALIGHAMAGPRPQQPHGGQQSNAEHGPKDAGPVLDQLTS